MAATQAGDQRNNRGYRVGRFDQDELPFRSQGAREIIRSRSKGAI